MYCGTRPNQINQRPRGGYRRTVHEEIPAMTTTETTLLICIILMLYMIWDALRKISKQLHISIIAQEAKMTESQREDLTKQYIEDKEWNNWWHPWNRPKSLPR
jgi:hypothetical protein